MNNPLISKPTRTHMPMTMAMMIDVILSKWRISTTDSPKSMISMLPEINKCYFEKNEYKYNNQWYTCTYLPSFWIIND